jgi:hypothetical protein
LPVAGSRFAYKKVTGYRSFKLGLRIPAGRANPQKALKPPTSQAHY